MSYVRIRRSQLSARLESIADDAARRGGNRVALRARASVLGQGRIDTHEMIRGFRVERVAPLRPGTVRYRVYNTAKHFPFQELGTPRGAEGVGYIYPKRARALRFKPKGSNVYIYARRVRGVKPGEFLKKAAAATQAKDFAEGPLSL